MDKKRALLLLCCLLLAGEFSWVRAQGDENLNFCDIACVNNIYRYYCGDATCTTGASDYGQIFSLCTEACAGAVIGEVMMECLSTTAPDRSDWDNIQASVLGEIVEFCFGYQITIDPETAPLLMEDTDEELRDSLFDDPEAEGDNKNKKSNSRRKKNRQSRKAKQDEDEEDQESRKERRRERREQEEHQTSTNGREPTAEEEAKGLGRSGVSSENNAESLPNGEAEDEEIITRSVSSGGTPNPEAIGSVGSEEDVSLSLESDVEEISSK